MAKGLRDLTLKDILFGIVIPVIVCLVIIWFPLNERTLAGINPAFQGIFVFGVQEVIMIVAVPMMLGLMWNKWAGGASGFLLGSIYALWYAIYGIRAGSRWTGDISLLGYLLSGMLIGYMAGALNQRSHAFSRLLFSGLTAGIVGGLFLFLTEQLSPLHMVTGAYGFFITITPRIVFGIIIPVFAKLFIRYGVTPKKILGELETHTQQ
jgi:hypothetical protein